MPRRNVVLVNSNEMKPPVAPLALDYIGGRVAAAGIEVTLVDLSFVDDPAREIAHTLADADPIAIGVSFRNTDDCYLSSGAWFVPRLGEIIELIRSATPVPIVLGGCGFSIFPVRILETCGVDLAVVGDGEDAFLKLVQCLTDGKDYRSVAGLAYRDDHGEIMLNPPRYNGSLDIPIGRQLIDNARYLREGAMGSIETKRGCPEKCIYCADPLAKGRIIRCRPAGQVADEIESLLGQGVDILHLCDGEFNIPSQHAMAVCEEMIARKLGDRVRWYCYASVEPFSAELATEMRRAGCVGINFGADSGCNRMLAALGRTYDREDIQRTVRYCRGAGISVMLDLLIGGPGEDATSVAETIDFVKAADPDRAGAATGVRIYPGTRLAEIVSRQGPLPDNPNLQGHVIDNAGFFRPVFYVERQLGDDPGALVCDLIGGDGRFFPPPRAKDATNYNYNDNLVIQEAIAAGHRGAFWDILRRLASEKPKPLF